MLSLLWPIFGSGKATVFSQAGWAGNRLLTAATGARRQLGGHKRGGGRGVASEPFSFSSYNRTTQDNTHAGGGGEIALLYNIRILFYSIQFFYVYTIYIFYSILFVYIYTIYSILFYSILFVYVYITHKR